MNKMPVPEAHLNSPVDSHIKSNIKTDTFRLIPCFIDSESDTILHIVR